jgi:hypothetical protein
VARRQKNEGISCWWRERKMNDLPYRTAWPKFPNAGTSQSSQQDSGSPRQEATPNGLNGARLENLRLLRRAGQSLFDGDAGIANVA